MPIRWREKLRNIKESGGQLSQLMRHSPSLSRQVLGEIPQWDAQFGKEFRQWLVATLLELRHLDGLTEIVVGGVQEHLSGCTNLHRQRIQRLFLPLCQRWSRPSDLPQWTKEIWLLLPKWVQQFDDGWIHQWVTYALDNSKGDVRTAGSLLRMETRQSMDAWNVQSKRVYIDDLQRRLWPYMESHLGKWQGLVQIHLTERQPHTDSIDLYLPAFVEISTEGTQVDGVYLQRKGWQQYRLWVARLTAFFEFGSFEFDIEDVVKSVPEPRENELMMERFFRSFPNQSLAKKIFFALEEFRILSQLERVYPGVYPKVRTQLASESTAFCNEPVQSEFQRALQDVFRMLYDISSKIPIHASVIQYKEMLPSLQSTDKKVEDTIQVMERIFSSLHSLTTGVSQVVSTTFDTQHTQSSRRRLRFKAQNSQKFLSKERDNAPNNPDVNNSLADRQRMIVDFDEQLAFLDAHPGSRGGMLADRERSEREVPDLPPEFVVDGEPIPEGQYRYPEWDSTMGDWRHNWTLVREIAINPHPEGLQFWERTQLELGQEMRKVRSVFQMLRDGLTVRKRGLNDGDRLEFDRWMDARIQRKMGQTPKDNLYSKALVQNRDPAVAFLVDLSSSTNEITKGAIPILDVEKSALLLMSEALASIGDPFAIFGFSGFGREQVVFYIAKELHEPWQEDSKAKVGSLKWKLENRDGAAIRHATAKMKTWAHQQKILFILSDGKPLDCGDKYYFDHQAQADTRQAIVEAREAGITPFCITVDPYGQEYLPTMYGPNGYVAIDNMDNFAHHLAKVYAAMTLR